MSGFSNKHRPPAPIHYSGLNVGSSQYDLPIPIFWGTRRIPTNAIWYNHFTKHPVGGKGKGGGAKSQQAYDYKAAVILGLCEGPVNELTLIWANGSTTTTTTLSALNMIFSAGASNAAPWTYVSSDPSIASQALAYRLTSYVACPTLDLGESATIPNNDFEALRTVTVSFAVGASPTTTFIPWAGAAPANYAGYVGAGLAMLTGAAATQTSTVSAATASGLTLAPALGVAPAAGDAFGLGFGYTFHQPHGGWINPNSHVQAGCTDCLMSDIVTDLLTNAQYGLGFTAADIGPFAQYAAYQRAQGLAFSPLLNSAEKATAVLDRWAQLSNAWIYWSGTALQFTPLADTAITGNGVTFTPDNDVAYDLGLADFIADAGEDSGPVKVSRRDPADAYNRTVVNFTDRTLGYISNPVEFRDQGLVDAYGLRDNANVQADEVCDPAVARIVVQLIGKRAAYIRNTYAFRTSYRFIRCLPGCVLTLTEPSLGLAKARVRVTKVSEDDKGLLAFECEEFPGTAATYVAPLTAPAVNTATTPDLFVDPGSVNAPAVIEPDAAFTGGTPQLIIAASGGRLSAPDTAWGGCTVYISFDGVNYSQIGVITAAARQGFLMSGLAAYGGANPDTGDTLAVDCSWSWAAPVTSVTHADADALRTLSLIAPPPSGSAPAVIANNGELLAFGAVAATGAYSANLTYLQRGQYGTAPGAHATNDLFTQLNVLASDGSSIAYALPPQYVGVPIYLKLASFNVFGLAQQDLSACVEYQYTPSGAGFEVVATADANLPAGAFVYVHDVGGAKHAALADNATGAYANGFVLNAVASGALGVVETSGFNAAVAVAANQAQVWLGTAGGYLASPPTAPGALVQVIGNAVVGKGVYFLPAAAPANPAVRLVETEAGAILLTEAGLELTTET